MRDLRVGCDGREKINGWLPNYMAFPFKAYTRNSGIRIEDAMSKVKGPSVSSARPVR